MLPSCRCHFQRLGNFLGSDASWQGEVTRGGPCWYLILCLLVQRDVQLRPLTSLPPRTEMLCPVFPQPHQWTKLSEIKSQIKYPPYPAVCFYWVFWPQQHQSNWCAAKPYIRSRMTSKDHTHPHGGAEEGRSSSSSYFLTCPTSQESQVAFVR